MLTNGVSNLLTASALMNGIAEPVEANAPAVVPLVVSVDRVAVSENGACAASQDAVWCWGQAEGESLFSSSTSQDLDAPELELADGKITDLAVGAQHLCVTVAGGQVLCVGAGLEGQLGDGEATDSIAPVLADWDESAVAVAAGYRTSCAFSGEGAVVCWGRGEEGSSGLGNSMQSDVPHAVAGLDGVVALDVGMRLGCALSADGVHCWGGLSNSYLAGLGLVGGAKEFTSLPYPVAIPGVVVDVDIAAQRGCAVTADGGLYCWGNNLCGAVGAELPEVVWTPTAMELGFDVARVSLSGPSEYGACGDFPSLSTCAIGTAGTVVCWGTQLKYAIQDDAVGHNTVLGPSAVPLPDGLIATDLAVERDYFAVLEQAGVVWARASAGTFGEELSPLMGTDGDPIVQLGGGGHHFCSLSLGGEVQCVGSNDHCQLGSCDGGSSNVPVSIELPLPAVSIAVANDGACAVLEDGSVACFGVPLWGAAIPYFPLGAFPGPSPLESSPGSWLQAVSLGTTHLCAIGEDELAYCAGPAWDGLALGRGLGYDPLSWGPAQELTGVQLLVAARDFSCALSNSGNLSCWGVNTSGELGIGQAAVNVSPSVMLAW